MHDVDPDCSGPFLLTAMHSAETAAVVSLALDDRTRSEKAVFTGFEQDDPVELIGYIWDEGAWVEAARAIAMPAAGRTATQALTFDNADDKKETRQSSFHVDPTRHQILIGDVDIHEGGR